MSRQSGELTVKALSSLLGTSTVAESAAWQKLSSRSGVADELEGGLHARGGRALRDLVVPELRDLALDNPMCRLAQVAAGLQDGRGVHGSLVLGQSVVGVLQQRLELEVLVEIERQQLRQHGVADRIDVRARVAGPGDRA